MISPADPDSLRAVRRLDARGVAQVFGSCPQATTGRIRRNRGRTVTNPSGVHGETTRSRSSYASGRSPVNVECRKIHTLMKYRRSLPRTFSAQPARLLRPRRCAKLASWFARRAGRARVGASVRPSAGVSAPFAAEPNAWWKLPVRPAAPISQRRASTPPPS